MPSAAPLQLTYARPARISSRRWAWRLFFFTWAAFTIDLAWDVGVPFVKVQAPLLSEQRRCMNFMEPKDRIVYSSKPDDITRLKQLHGYKPTGAARSAVVSDIADTQLTAFTTRFSDRERYAELHNPQPARHRNTIAPFGMGGAWGSGTKSCLFLHRLNSGGAERLVAIDYVVNDYFDSSRIRFGAEVYSVASWIGVSERIQSEPMDAWGAYTGCEIWLPIADFVRLYAGQPDAADPSHFTLNYQTSRGSGTIEGRLGANDRVQMKILSGPAFKGKGT